MNKYRLRAYVFMLITSIIWGVAGPVIKYTLNDFPPLVFLTYRFFLSSILAFVIWRGLPSLPQKFDRRLHIFIYSLLTVPVPLGLLFLGFAKTSSIEGTLISTVAPLLMLLAGWLFLRERVTNIEIIGISVAFFGTLLVVVEPLFAHGWSGNGSSTSGNILIFLSLVTETIGFLFAKKALREDTSPLMLANISFVIGFLVFLPLTLFLVGPGQLISAVTNAPWTAHLGVWYMALLSGSLAYTLKNLAIKTIEVSEATVFSYLFPVWAAPLSIWWLHEQVSPVFLIGAVIIATGVMIAEIKASRHGN